MITEMEKIWAKPVERLATRLQASNDRAQLLYLD